MARAWDNVEELRRRVDEVDDLRDEKKNQSLAEVTHNAYNGKHHSCKVAVCIAHEDLGGKPVVLEKGERYSEEGQQKIYREKV